MCNSRTLNIVSDVMHEWRGDYCGGYLQGGVKNILLAKYNPEVVIDLSYCGDRTTILTTQALRSIKKRRNICAIGTKKQKKV